MPATMQMDAAVPGMFDLTLSDLMKRYPQTVPVFMRHRMLCVGCPIGPFHSISDACMLYALDEDEFRAELEAAIGSVEEG